MKAQQGIGLVEVLVALLLLAIAILGFSAMQLTAVKATDESLMRTQALSIMKNLSEAMRSMPGTSDKYQLELNNLYKKVDVNSKTPVESYCEKEKNYTSKNCKTDICNDDEIVNYDVKLTTSAACDKSIALNMVNCPATSGTNLRQCIIAAWEDTAPTMDDSNKICTNNTGIYKPGATCFIMEAY